GRGNLARRLPRVPAGGQVGLPQGVPQGQACSGAGWAARAGRGRDVFAEDGVVRLAYADPPYLGCCRLYQHHHPDGRCWDDLETHRLLVERLCDEYPDGWALSATSSSLR